MLFVFDGRAHDRQIRFTIEVPPASGSSGMPFQNLDCQMVLANPKYPIINYLDAKLVKIQRCRQIGMKARARNDHPGSLPICKCPRIRGCNRTHEVVDLSSRLRPMDKAILGFTPAKIAAL